LSSTTTNNDELNVNAVELLSSVVIQNTTKDEQETNTNRDWHSWSR